MSDQENIRYIARNRKARHDYEIRDTLEAGIELKGSEVKSLRAGKATLTDAYAIVEGGQVFLKKLHISNYKMGQDELDPLRPRRLLLHKRQINKLFTLTEERGCTLIVLSLYFRENLVKVELAVAVGRRKYDKRHKIDKADADRQIRQATRKKY